MTKTVQLPVLPLTDVVVLPGMVVPVTGRVPEIAGLQGSDRRAAELALQYMDLEPEPTVTASDRASGTFGFAGSAPRDSGAEPTGLATLTSLACTW